MGHAYRSPAGVASRAPTGDLKEFKIARGGSFRKSSLNTSEGRFDAARTL
jgi:hypothetical protein